MNVAHLGGYNGEDDKEVSKMRRVSMGAAGAKRISDGGDGMDPTGHVTGKR